MIYNYSSKSICEGVCFVDDERVEDYDEVRIFYFKPEEEGRFLFFDCLVDLNAEFIEYEKILTFTGMHRYVDLLHFALGCVEYYGPTRFSSGKEVRCASEIRHIR